jgi:ATP-dependent Clp protease ATP-binding subunit ClpC
MKEPAFTDRARRVFRLARLVATDLGEDVITPLHILLATLREGEGVAVAVFRNLGVIDRLEATALRNLGVSNPARTWTSLPRGPAPRSEIPGPYSPGTDRAFDNMRQVATSLGHEYAGTEHIPLGLLMLGMDPASTTLTESGVTEDNYRSALRKVLGML